MRKIVVWVMIAGFAALVALGIGARFMRPDPLPTLTKADRAPLLDTVAAGRRVLKHPTLGFTFLHPGDAFSEAPELVAALRKSQPDPKVHFYALGNAEQTAQIIIGIVNEAVPSRDEMTRQLGDFKRELLRGANVPGRPEMQVVTDSIVWDATQHEAHMHATQGDAHYRARILAMTPKGHAPVVVMFMTVTGDEQALTDVLASVTP